MLRAFDSATSLGLGDRHVGPAKGNSPRDSVTEHFYVGAVAGELDRGVALAAVLLELLVHPSALSWQDTSKGCYTDYNETFRPKMCERVIRLPHYTAVVNTQGSGNTNLLAKHGLARRRHLLPRSICLMGLDLYTVHPPC